MSCLLCRRTFVYSMETHKSSSLQSPRTAVGVAARINKVAPLAIGTGTGIGIWIINYRKTAKLILICSVCFTCVQRFVFSLLSFSSLRRETRKLRSIRSNFALDKLGGGGGGGISKVTRLTTTTRIVFYAAEQQLPARDANRTGERTEQRGRNEWQTIKLPSRLRVFTLMLSGGR